MHSLEKSLGVGVKNGEKMDEVYNLPIQDVLLNYLHDHIKYTIQARIDSIQGTGTVTFIVNKNGKLTNIKTIGQAKGGSLEEEAINVVKNMPKWKPGKQNGKSVNVQFNLPVRFQLDNAPSPKTFIFPTDTPTAPYAPYM